MGDEGESKKEMKPITCTNIFKEQLSLQTWTKAILRDLADGKWSKAKRLDWK